jgi:hypothetical protein
MLIRELLEDNITPVPPGQSTPLPSTAPTQQTAAQNTATNASAALKQQQMVNNQTTMTDLDKIAAQIVGLKQKISSTPQLA